ncbi:MAG: hypothetical protein ABEI74_02135 [Candidatus Pacearchaeota archaeon]
MPNYGGLNMNREKIMSGIVKGIFGAALTSSAVIIIDILLISLSNLPIILIIAILGPFLTGFLSEISGPIVCRDSESTSRNE